MNDILLTIGIPSYNRTKELIRCLESIQTSNPQKIEILVCEDKSPNRAAIQELVNNFAVSAKEAVRFHTNEKNLGYDRNLKKIIELAKGEYVLYISDDDMLIPDSLDQIITLLESKPSGVFFSPFHLTRSGEYRRKYSQSYRFEPASKFAHDHIYDSILFSGLIFQREAVAQLDAEKFLNKIYFQVYMYLFCANFYGGYYSTIPLIECVDDGDVGFGTSESSDNPDLQNKASPITNIEYDRGMIFCVREFDKDYSTDYFASFEREYNIRSCTYLGKARDISRQTLIEYWKKLNTLDVHLNWITRIYYRMFLLFGSSATRMILKLPKKILFVIRGEKQKQ